MKKVVSILLSVMMIMSVVVGTSVFADSTNNTDKKMCKVHCIYSSSPVVENEEGYNFLTNPVKETEKGKPYTTNIKFNTNVSSNCTRSEFNVAVIMGDGTIIEPILVSRGNFLVVIPDVVDDIYICINGISEHKDDDVIITGNRTKLFVWNLNNVTSSEEYQNKEPHSGHYAYNFGTKTYAPKEGYKITSIKILEVVPCYDTLKNEYTYEIIDRVNSDRSIVKDNGDGTYTALDYMGGSYYIEVNAEPIVLPTKPTVNKITKVALNKKSVTLNKGKSTTVKATVTPVNATNKKLKWTTSNSKVATVSQSGKITAKGRGIATIKTMSTDGSNKYATLKVTVKQPVTSVKLNRKSATLKVKGNAKQKTVTLKAKVYPNNANNKTVKWSTSKSKIATVNSKGKVIAKKKGTCYIIATAKDGSKKSAKCKITVK